MGDYSQAAEFYDLLYAETKDYAAESAIIAELIRAARPDARRVLDVACGTGKHAEALTALGFVVDGVEVEPAFVARAAQRCPEGSSHVGGAAENVVVCRISRTLIEGPVSRLEFEYLIGTAEGIERRSERHCLGLFTGEQMKAAFHGAGLSVEWRDAALRRRGAYVGQLPESRVIATVRQ